MWTHGKLASDPSALTVKRQVKEKETNTKREMDQGRGKVSSSRKTCVIVMDG